MMVGGIFMALREDLGLAWLVAVAVPALGDRDRPDHLADGAALPLDADRRRLGQPHPARADHRHPGRARLRPRGRRARALRRAPTAPTPAPRCAVGKLMALAFPVVMVIFNASTVAVLWFGAHRIDNGQMQIGALTAFMSYLIQILMSVMMATFMSMMIPRATVSRRPHPGGARHRDARCTRRPTRSSSRPGPVDRRAARRRRSPTRAPSRRCCARSSLRAEPGTTTADRRLDRRRQDHAGRPRPAAVRRDRRRRCSSAGSTCATPSPRTLWSHDRPGAAAALPVHRHGRARNLRYGEPDATDDELWQALEVAQADDFVRGHARRARVADRPGRHQRQRRPAPAARHRAGPGAQGRDLPVRRLVLGARRRHRRPAAGRAAAGDPGRDGHRRRPAGVDASSTPTGSSCSTTAGSSGSGTHARAARQLPDVREIVESQQAMEEAA